MLFEEDTEPVAALAGTATHPRQRATVALIADGAVLVQVNAATSRATRALHDDGHGTPIARRLRFGIGVMFGHTACPPVCLHAWSVLQRILEFRAFSP